MYPLAADSAAPFTVVDVTYIAPSSTYMVRSQRDHLLVISKRLAVYIADRMGDRGEPCGVPLIISNGSDTCPPPLRVAVRAERKDSTQAHIPVGKPLSLNICMAQVGLRLSKKPEMSNSRRAPARLATLVAYMRWMRVAAVSITEWWGWDPNCVIGSRSCAWMSSLILLETIFSRSFPAHSIREMGQ